MMPIKSFPKHHLNIQRWRTKSSFPLNQLYPPIECYFSTSNYSNSSAPSKGTDSYGTSRQASPNRQAENEGDTVGVRSMSAGLPDWIEHWNRHNFRKVGYGLATCSLLSLPHVFSSDLHALLSTTLVLSTTAYWTIGLKDIRQTDQTIRRNFPVLGNVRYLLESIRPEIRQYFIEGDFEAVPFSRHQRTMVYRRAKGRDHKMPFGTRMDTSGIGYTWCQHSLYPTKLSDADQRVLIGANTPSTTQPYSSSLLNISAMSYGALSDKAILALSQGAKLGNFSHNTGEGGVSTHHIQGGADLVWNVGTAYFGCGKFDGNGNRIFDPDLFAANSTHPNIKMIEVKLSQGAKPAHGGILSRTKISKDIAEARNLTYPVENDCISPPTHSSFSNPKQMCLFISHLRELSGGKPIGIKLCVGSPHEFLELVHAFVEAENDESGNSGTAPDFITIDGGEGGTGSAPPEFSNYVGTPLADGLSLAHATLVGAGLRDPRDKSKSRIALLASGKILSGFSMYRTFALGADVCNAARSFLFSLGCIQALKCHSNKCPTGITTQDPELTWGLDPSVKYVRVANFHKATVHAAVELMEATGVKSSAEIQPHHVNVRAGFGETHHFGQVYRHLDEIGKGDLLSGVGPKELQKAWERRNMI